MVVCISTGALTSMAIDLDVPERYGIKQSVGDTVGPGDDEIDQAVLHEVAAGIIRDDRVRHTLVAKLPGGQRSAVCAVQDRAHHPQLRVDDPVQALQPFQQ